jgi:uncharacterized zinc-type alcohol dehydrogenase-like protein
MQNRPSSAAMPGQVLLGAEVPVVGLLRDDRVSVAIDASPAPPDGALCTAGAHRLGAPDPGDTRLCAEHNIGAEVAVIPAEAINDAYERVLASDVRYRFVIDARTLA